MKMFSRLLITIITGMFIVGLQVMPVKAEGSDLVLTPTEEYVKSALLNHGEAVLREKFPDPKDREIRGSFVASLFTSPDLQTKPFIKIYNAIIVDDINADGVSIPFNVEFHDCVFNGRINLDSAEVKTFRIDDSTVKGSVRMGRLAAKGDLALYRSTFESEVTLFDASIDKNLFARGSKFLGAIPDSTSKYPFELWKVQVGQTTEFTNAVIKGEVGADDAKFGVDVKFDGAIFEKPATFMNIQVGNLADFQKARFKDNVTFESGVVERDILFSGATFSGAAKFDYFTSGRFIDFVGTKLNDFSFIYTNVGWPYFKDTVFNGHVDFEGMEASNEFELTDAKYKNLNEPSEPFTVYLAKVDGRVLFTGFSAEAGLDLENNQFGDLEITGQAGRNFDVINLGSTKVEGNLKVQDVTAGQFLAQGLKVNGSTTFMQTTVSNELNLSNASLGYFTLSDQPFWPTLESGKFDLRALTYTDIAFATLNKDGELEYQEFDGKQKQDLLNGMVAESVYSPQAYRTLEQVMTENGHPGWAADVEYARKVRERDHILAQGSSPWFLSWFLCLFSGYGQRPIYALGWSVAIILSGTWFFRNPDDFDTKEKGDDKPTYNPFLYSFALFIPFFEFDFTKSWDPKPNRTFIIIYKQVHRLLGWIVAPIALLAFSGIIK